MRFTLEVDEVALRERADAYAAKHVEDAMVPEPFRDGVRKHVARAMVVGYLAAMEDAGEAMARTVPIVRTGNPVRRVPLGSPRRGKR